MINETKTLDSDERREIRYYPICGCFYGPANQFGNYLWGAILVFAGGIWLLQNIGLIPGTLLDVLWPLVLIGVGVSILGWALYGRIQESG
jgi:hypothetical protein